MRALRRAPLCPAPFSASKSVQEQRQNPLNYFFFTPSNPPTPPNPPVPQATEKQIRSAYRRVALLHHPDKNPSSEEAIELFSRCAQAYEVLSDPVSRSMYDMLTGVKPETTDEMGRINRIKREQASKAVALMEESVGASIAEEQERNGLVVVEARYGDLSEGARAGAWINVTVPLQCMVASSTLVLPAGASKSWLEGFYDPCPGVEKQLSVRYKFLGMPHQCLVDDADELCMPLESHAADAAEADALAAAADGAAPVADFRQKRLLLQKEARTKRRRRWALLAAITAVAGFFLARHRGVFQDPELRMRVAAVSPLILRLLGPGRERVTVAPASARM